MPEQPEKITPGDYAIIVADSMMVTTANEDSIGFIMSVLTNDMDAPVKNFGWLCDVDEAELVIESLQVQIKEIRERNENAN